MVNCIQCGIQSNINDPQRTPTLLKFTLICSSISPRPYINSEAPHLFRSSRTTNKATNLLRIRSSSFLKTGFVVVEMENKLIALILFFLFGGLVSESFCRSLEGVGDEKNYYTPETHHSSHKSSSCSTPTPSHRSSGKSPVEPSHGTPSTPTPSSASQGGGGGGGYYNTPPSSPSSPAVRTPPATPVTNTPPTTPVTETPLSPLIPDPNTYFPAPCSYWKSHPAVIWALFGYWGTVGDYFGAACATAYGHDLSLQEALGNTRGDGIGELYRQGTAAFLNSIAAAKKFPYTTQQVKDAFAAAAISNEAAAAQAAVFKLANEGQPTKQ